MKRLLITGAEGFLGIRTALYYSSLYELITCNHSDLDITDAQTTQKLIQDWKPDIVIHCAAISDTGLCERNPSLSESVNLEGSVNIAKACQDTGAQLIYMSSDQVYNGIPGNEPCPETLLLNPSTVYGRHKLQAEQAISDLLPDAIGLRLTWMYDLPDSPYKLNRNLLVNLTHASQNHETVKAATHEFRGITNVWEVVRHLTDCTRLPGGVYNFGCENRLNSYDTFMGAARLLHLPKPETWIIPDEERHPRNLNMDITLLRSHGIDFPDTLDGIRQSLQ